MEKPITRRQREVLDLVLRGLSNKEIANALGVAEITVKKHVSGLLQHFGAENRRYLILRIFESRKTEEENR